MATTLGAISPGQLVTLNESGSPVQFYVACQDYESVLNGAGRTLLVRKDLYQLGEWNSTNVNTYAGSTIDNWFNTTYLQLLDPWVAEAAGTTTFYYTPGNGNNTVTTLTRAVFALSLTELGLTNSMVNIEGSKLEISTSLSSLILSPQWSRSPTVGTNSAAGVSTGSVYTGQVTNVLNYRPCLTLPTNLTVLPDGTLQATPTFNTLPIQVMEGQSLPVSWSAMDGATSYTLQRQVDSGEWETIYTGADTTYTDTVPDGSTLQYQVSATVSGTPGAFAQSDAIQVVSASALAISGQDGDLGTITNDIPYAVSTDTGNQISLTRTVNGALVASLTVDSGFAYNIPVLDLPTGTGTIVITATVETDSDPVTATRTWTYTKAAQSFPNSGGLAQLTQDGQNVFPLTLAEAVKAIGGPWGGNLSTALDKLATAATYTATAVPKYTAVTVDLSTAQAGDIVNLPENGVMVPFYVASLDYEPTLNTSGTRVLLVRKDVYQNGAWNSSSVNTYANSTIDTWFNGTYKALLDLWVQDAIGTTTFYYTPGNGNTAVTTLARAVFALSLTELGVSNDSANTEGGFLSTANILQIAYMNGSVSIQWTRSPAINGTDVSIAQNSGIGSRNFCFSNFGYRPCFTLPATFSATYYVDPNSGTVYPEQEYTTAGDFADLWGNIIPTVKSETGSYTGTGTYGEDNPVIISTTFPPKAAFVIQKDFYGYGTIFPFIKTSNRGTVLAGTFNTLYNLVVKWGENSVSFYGTDGPPQQLNASGNTYAYLIFG